MTDERSKDEPAPDDEVTPSAPEPAKKPDLRVSSHQDLGVSVSRDLNAAGWLARGDRSNMSKLRFSVQAKPRDELDPELQALRNPPPLKASRDAGATSAPDTAASPPDATPEPDAVPPTDTAKPDGLLGRLGRLFGGE